MRGRRAAPHRPDWTSDTLVTCGVIFLASDWRGLQHESALLHRWRTGVDAGLRIRKETAGCHKSPIELSPARLGRDERFWNPCILSPASTMCNATYPSSSNQTSSSITDAYTGDMWEYDVRCPALLCLIQAQHCMFRHSSNRIQPIGRCLSQQSSLSSHRMADRLQSKPPKKVALKPPPQPKSGYDLALDKYEARFGVPSQAHVGT